MLEFHGGLPQWSPQGWSDNLDQVFSFAERSPPMVENTIRELELRLLEPAIRRDATALDELLADDFVEFGSSGRVYAKPDILQMLPISDDLCSACITQFSASVFDDTVHARYRLKVTDPTGGTRSSLRSSIWRKVNGAWYLCFHQGTEEHE